VSAITEHPDVRRMLMTQRAWIDAMRCLVYSNAAALDRAVAARAAGDAGEAQRWQERVDVLIPLTKGLCTDVGNELTSLALQVHGGMGYVEETGAAQHYRDARIAAIYEGTNGIQAADLVGRKLAMRNGGVVTDLLDEIGETAQRLTGLDRFAIRLDEAVTASRRATEHLLSVAGTDQRSLLAGSAPYLRLLGTTVCAGLLAKGAIAASSKDDDFHRGKVLAAKYFGEQILPVATGLLGAIEAGSADLDAITL
jgi:acyl-CoA dehydrogenase